VSGKRRIFVIALQQEVSTFNPVPSTYADFEVLEGAAMAGAYRGTDTYAGGAFEVLEEAGAEAVPVFSAVACSAGTLADDAYAHLRARLHDATRAALKDGAPDGVVFLMHGAMSAVSERDPEGDVLVAVRAIVGPDAPFAMSLDLHGILTARMLAACPAVETLRTYPHVDFRDTGERAARLLLRQLDEGVRPVAARVRMPLLVRGDECITETGIYGRYVDRATAIAGEAGMLSGALMIGNPFTDVPELCCQAVAVTDGDPEKAAAAALRIADGFFDEGPRIQADLVSLDEAVEIAGRTTGHVVLKDAADAPSSGASGDSVAILAALLAAGYAGTVLAPVVDANAVALAQKVGTGGRATFRLGGQCDPRFAPLEIEAEVAMLSDGAYRMETWGTMEAAGPSAKLRAGPVTIVATSRPVQLFDRSLFFGHGEDPRHYDVNIVKSPHTQRRYYDDWAAVTVSVDAPGSTSARVETLGHTIAARPMFPLDRAFAFTPHVEHFGEASSR